MKKQQIIKENKKEISIPLYIPILIAIIFIIIYTNIYNPNSTAIATTDKKEVQSNFQNEIEKEEIIPEPSNEDIEEVIEQPVEEPIIEPVEQPKPETSTYTINGKQYTVVGTVEIPSLGIKYPILSETSTQLLKVSVTKYWGANPNEVGNMVILGHNYKNSKFFGNLLKIKQGEIVKITDLSGKTLNYKVYDTQIIDPNDNSCTSQLTNGKTEVTLITCYYENGSSHATKRFVVKARVE